ncbi:hypothetical protein NCG97_34410 [Streptomyces lydicamycinicus]|uniref:hypothetical protein n=1 Tax=Streptomyces lydicamycinicus TaxID=1546107 RepID=UPI00203628DD|nr:hypothetical protein [Streptomyces lydicamycinicus]USA05498.1 hypothetical protein NCG97_34410 [Streptomyces lydicamycinicus]
MTGEPGAGIGPELLLGGREVEVHQASASGGGQGSGPARGGVLSWAAGIAIALLL